MSSGGARAKSGPPPDPNALRRDRDGTEWVHLPAAGRQGPTPYWPLTRANKREQDVWAEEWIRPQAVMWEANHQEREVAIYVRWFVRSERANASVALGTLVRQLQEALGLSLPGLARNRWIIASTQDRAERPKIVGGTSTKERARAG
jgi:hypothetical protein